MNLLTKMENKRYYTPDIKEFRVGFEFEMRNSSDETNYDWEKCVLKPDFTCEMDEDFDSYQLMSDLKNEFIRVKYLDEEDILECGFEKYRNYYISKNNPQIELYKSEYSDNIEISSMDCGIFYKVKFYGIIKNKSELKELLEKIL